MTNEEDSNKLFDWIQKAPKSKLGKLIFTFIKEERALEVRQYLA